MQHGYVTENASALTTVNIQHEFQSFQLLLFADQSLYALQKKNRKT